MNSTNSQNNSSVNLFSKLNSLKLGSQNQWVVFLMGSLLVVDSKSCWSTKASARRAMSVAISKQYTTNPEFKKEYASVGDFRKALEDKSLIQVVKDTDIRVVAKL